MLWKKKFPQNKILLVWKSRLVFWSHPTSSSPAAVDHKGNMFLLSKINRNFLLNRNLDKFLFGQFLTIIVGRDLIFKIKISHWLFILVLLLNSGSEKHWAKDEKTAGIFEIGFFSKNLERQILAKVGQIKILRKYPDKIRVCLKTKKSGKILSNI